jgi:UDP-N-acetylglucosamine 4-epimerase
VIPKFTQALMAHESPLINGDGSNSRDFTYIDNVIQMNHLAALTSNPLAKGQVYNTAVGDRADLNQLTTLLKKYLSVYDPKIAEIAINYGPERRGDIPHSLASIEKAKTQLGYRPSHNLEAGLELAVKWYWESFKGLGNRD